MTGNTIRAQTQVSPEQTYVADPVLSGIRTLMHEGAIAIAGTPAGEGRIAQTVLRALGNPDIPDAAFMQPKEFQTVAHKITTALTKYCEYTGATLQDSPVFTRTLEQYFADYNECKKMRMRNPDSVALYHSPEQMRSILQYAEEQCPYASPSTVRALIAFSVRTPLGVIDTFKGRFETLRKEFDAKHISNRDLQRICTVSPTVPLEQLRLKVNNRIESPPVVLAQAKAARTARALGGISTAELAIPEPASIASDIRQMLHSGKMHIYTRAQGSVGIRIEHIRQRLQQCLEREDSNPQYKAAFEAFGRTWAGAIAAYETKQLQLVADTLSDEQLYHHVAAPFVQTILYCKHNDIPDPSRVALYHSVADIEQILRQSLALQQAHSYITPQIVRGFLGHKPVYFWRVLGDFIAKVEAYGNIPEFSTLPKETIASYCITYSSDSDKLANALRNAEIDGGGSSLWRAESELLDNESDLRKAFAAGDEIQFWAWVRVNAEPLKRNLTRFTGSDWRLAEDALQEGLLRLWRNRHTIIDADIPVRSVVVRYARSALSNMRRAEKIKTVRYPTIDPRKEGELDNPGTLLDEGVNIEDAVVASETINTLIRNTLLTSKELLVIQLIRRGHSLSDVSELHKISRERLESLLASAVSKMRASAEER